MCEMVPETKQVRGKERARIGNCTIQGVWAGKKIWGMICHPGEHLDGWSELIT